MTVEHFDKQKNIIACKWIKYDYQASRFCMQVAE